MPRAIRQPLPAHRRKRRATRPGRLQAAEEPSEAGSNAGPAATSRPLADRRYEEIYLLADYGFDPAEIGHRVGMPVGEIQLILSLRAKR